MTLKDFLNSNTGKFVKGGLTSGGSALTGFLVAQGCHITGVKEFLVSAGAAVIGGLIHTLINQYANQNPQILEKVE